MKKVLIIFLLCVFSTPVFASNWIEIFEKKYIDTESITVNDNFKTIKFWTKNLRKDPKEKFPNYNGKMVDYWFAMDYWDIDCENKKSRIVSTAVYDLKKKIIYSDNMTPYWNNIIPDTYADGYYRLFCLIPFNENPLLKTLSSH